MRARLDGDPRSDRAGSDRDGGERTVIAALGFDAESHRLEHVGHPVKGVRVMGPDGRPVKFFRDEEVVRSVHRFMFDRGICSRCFSVTHTIDSCLGLPDDAMDRRDG